MNMHAALTETSVEISWSRVAAEVNVWRGACMQSFAQAEAAVTETLLLLSEAPGRGADVRLRHLVGQRLDDLARALGPDGGFSAEGATALEALTEFRLYEALRIHLAHDVARIALERNGSWVVVLRHISINGRAAERRTTAFEQEDALRTLNALKRATQRLDAALGNLRKAIGKQTGSMSV